jgi:hypothetical protein
MSDRGPIFCDVREPQAREQHKPVSCPDKILTAFCQLGALRMKARRCLIFFFDVSHAYVMAEATKTLSLEDDTTHEPGDQLWSKSSNLQCYAKAWTLFPMGVTTEGVMGGRCLAILRITILCRADFRRSGSLSHSSRCGVLRGYRQSSSFRCQYTWKLSRQRLCRR